ncbi:hypothetical protein STVIR_3572 [Streptomyces viridochromogenes Tue57]|uniref:Uncharacterized protein n=1 Tax=Streptomyces viridochromogenes Tue57 TaxID=1160705 RepID=L8PJA4_STRVR|nr:hypothetical protein STVIR_3572 [Streptomyces viridochromogenes Tue57]
MRTVPYVPYLRRRRRLSVSFVARESFDPALVHP